MGSKLWERCENFIKGVHSDEDLEKILRSLRYMWSSILERPVILGFENGEITLEMPCGSPSFNPKLTMRAALKTKIVISIEEKRFYFQAITVLDSKLQRLSFREMQALFWRYIDHSTKDTKFVSGREIAELMKIDEKVLRIYIGRAREKLRH